MRAKKARGQENPLTGRVARHLRVRAGKPVHGLRLKEGDNEDE